MERRRMRLQRQNIVWGNDKMYYEREFNKIELNKKEPDRIEFNINKRKEDDVKEDFNKENFLYDPKVSFLHELDRESLINGIILSEILGKPRAKRTIKTGIGIYKFM